MQVAVDYLVENLKKTLYLEKEESVPVYELLSVVAAQYNMTAEHYCEVTGGGRAVPPACTETSFVQGHVFGILFVIPACVSVWHFVGILMNLSLMTILS